MRLNLEYKKLIVICVLILTLAVPIFSINCKAQTSQRLYLNRVGFCNVEVGYDVHVVGDYAYVSNNDGLMIIDISNPRNPRKIGEVLTGGSSGFVIESNIAYIASPSDGFIIANVSDPTNTELLGQYSIGGGADKVAVSGSCAYVSSYGDGFKILNISNLINPTLLGEYSDTRSDDIQIKDGFVYLANAEAGLRVVDVSDPTTPLLVKTILQTGANDIYISNDILFLACWGAGIRIINITSPISPITLDFYHDNDEGEELGLIEKDGLLYVADNFGIELFNVSDPRSIIEIAERTSGVIAAHDIDVDDEYIYVAQGGGLLILEVSTTPESDGIGLLMYIIIGLSVTAVVLVVLSVVYFKIFKPSKRTTNN